jgi:hypothetical protein
MTAQSVFSQDLKSLVGQHLELSINDNRSTMLSVRWEPERTKVSLHRIFLQAPLHVRKDLVHYLRREKRRVPITIKAFIEESIGGLDYSHMLADNALSTKGRIYDLELLYKKINKKYFNNELKLLITWFGDHLPQSSSRCSLGLYYDAVKLVKVHRLLDAASVPSYVVEYIIYHEMVHAVCPAYIDERGINRMHGREFKEVEQRFEKYHEAIFWLNENKTTFFRSKGPYYGRAQ